MFINNNKSKKMFFYVLILLSLILEVTITVSFLNRYIGIISFFSMALSNLLIMVVAILNLKKLKNTKY